MWKVFPTKIELYQTTTCKILFKPTTIVPYHNLSERYQILSNKEGKCAKQLQMVTTQVALYPTNMGWEISGKQIRMLTNKT
jgi:hypothetical protein